MKYKYIRLTVLCLIFKYTMHLVLVNFLDVGFDNNNYSNLIF